MLRKIVSWVLVLVFAVSSLASCHISFSDPLQSEVDASAVTSVKLPAVKLHQTYTNTTDGSDTSGDEFSDVSGDESFPEEEVIKIPIRSIKQTEENVLDLYGDFDLSDPETAEAIRQIQELLAGYDKKLGIFVYSLDGSRAIAYNCEEIVFSACTIKAGYMLYCCLAIEQGIVSGDDVMIYEEKYKHGGSGLIKNAEYGTPYTIKELIRLSLRYSDNIAYKMLVHYFGKDGYNKMMKQLGVSRLCLSSSTSISSVWNYNTTAKDHAIIWRELYFYFETNTEMAQLYKKATTNTPYNYATKMLDEKYSHKSGDKFEPNPVYNDGSIVWKDTPYVIGMINASEGKDEDEYVIGNVIKLINDYLMN